MIVFVLFFVVGFWIISIYLLSGWKKLKGFLFINLVIAIILSILIYFSGDYIWGKDDFGILTFIRLALGIIIHAILMLFLAIYYRFKIKNEAKPSSSQVKNDQQ